MSQTVNTSTSRVAAPVRPNNPVKPEAAPSAEKSPPRDQASLSHEKPQAEANPGLLSGLADSFAGPGVGLANRAAGVAADTMNASNQGPLPSKLPFGLKVTDSPLAQAAKPVLPWLNTVAAPINLAQGGRNVDQGVEKIAGGESTAEKVEGGMQLGQGTAQLVAAGGGFMDLAAKATQGAGATSALGSTLLKFAGPAIPAFEGAMNLTEGHQAGLRGDTEEQLKKNYSGGAKLGGAGLMALGGALSAPITATVGGGIVLGTSIADQLNKTKPVQWAQDQVAGWFSGPDSTPAATKEQTDKLIAEHRARRAAQSNP